MGRGDDEPHRQHALQRAAATIFTSNYEDTPDIEALDSLARARRFRMHSRLHEMCEFLEYGGADYRLLPPNGGVDDLVALWKVMGEQRSRLPRAPRARCARS